MIYRDMAVSAMLRLAPSEDPKKQSIPIHVPPSTGEKPVSQLSIETEPEGT